MKVYLLLQELVQREEFTQEVVGVYSNKKYAEADARYYNHSSVEEYEVHDKPQE